MGSNLVIVALPAEDDLVWKVSSEKVPHLTLLFLGEVNEANNVDQMVQFVEHALTVSEHGSFYLDVDYRGELGEDKADVLFFCDGWDSKWIKSLRGQLLQEPNIRKAFESQEQFPEWLPHLTLGYPETPAKPIPDDRKIYSVQFDRIAIWTGDFEGPEFCLKWPERMYEDMAVAYSGVGKAAVDELLHVGVKGMRWGHRKTEMVIANGKAKMVTPKKAAKMDKAWEKQIYSVPGAVAVHNGMAEHFNQRIGAINDKYKDNDFSGAKWENPSSWTPREKQYMKEVDSLTLEGTRLAVEKVHGSSPTGKLRAELTPDGDSIVVKETKIQHAEDNTEAIAVLKITRNAKGLITKIVPLEEMMEESSMMQTAELGVEFIENFGGRSTLDHGAIFVEGLTHYGVKGMKWGHRRSDTRGLKQVRSVGVIGSGKKSEPVAVSPTAVSHVPQGERRKTQIEVQGGQNHKASEDAIKVAQARVKLAKSGPAALSNKELQEVANRIELEQRVTRATQSSSRKFVKNLLKQEGENTVRKGFKKGIKKGATTGFDAAFPKI